ncbi:two-component system response regulator AtoC [Anaerosolibacter carboniphilus]|uniref:Stage 0 sporulation protein A homolog n=1 Tax=Anaerosolibacter carboniphilus TaxID=1417629 RepID=A0A841L878_9FIRM|nr:sigma-54 dependent transcriptional regulator [Anaerosolibacter carboniphilus]MBB6218589.1 two-component system response regulator AtoC [Anaerosolibacter carboniphilus]
MKKRILIIDDEKVLCMSLKEGLKDFGYDVDTACTGTEGIKKLLDFKPQIIFLDMRLSEENGLEVIKKVKAIDKEVEVIMMTAYGDTKTAVTAIKNGAFDYIHKPFDLEEIQFLISKALKNFEMQKKIYLLEKEKQENRPFMISNHPKMREIQDKVEILSQNDKVTVLIRGETGTGKELVASAIHNHSVRKDASMLKINCGAIPQHLVESELFGFEKNAFTGAGARKKGLFELADGGTVFLDEVGELPLEMQAKLLRFLEEQKFKRIGGLVDIEVDIRIIAATNKDLEKAVQQKEFREDLYYRLNVVPIHLPPLRERGGDILLLAEHFLNVYNQKFGKAIKGITQSAKEQLLNYAWKGNVRELKNVIERIVILYRDDFIDSYHLPLEISQQPLNVRTNTLPEDTFKHRLIKEKFSLDEEIQRMEKAYIELALELSQDNYSKASQLLGISRFALKRKLEKYF